MLITIALVTILTSMLYKVMGAMNKPIVLGGVLSGVILANLHLSSNYFDLNSCNILGDFGATLFMMLMGLQFRVTTFTQRKVNLLITAVSLIVTFSVGLLSAQYLYKFNAGSSAHIGFYKFALLLSISMSIPSFTLVSLFLNQSHILKRNIAQLAMLLSFIEAIIFWVMESYLLISTQVSGFIKISESILLLGSISVVLIIIFPSIKFICRRIKTEESMLLFIIIGVCIFAVLGDVIDLHQTVGGFLFGILLPRNNNILDKITPKVETFVLVVLLPIFFAQVGGLARFGVIHNYKTILIAIILTIVALLTKFSGVFIGAKIAKYDNSEAAFLGALLNLRGVFEVVVIKVVWELGLISRTIFVILVIMAIASTWVSTSAALWFRNRLTLCYNRKSPQV